MGALQRTNRITAAIAGSFRASPPFHLFFTPIVSTLRPRPRDEKMAEWLEEAERQRRGL
jgi:hypothetical protein